MSKSQARLKVADILELMQTWAPLELSEAWDNTGLLLGDREASATRIMTCLTLTPESVAEAVECEASLVISHHPLPFKPLARITTDSMTGRLVWRLAQAGVSVYSPHTAWDSAESGINAQLARKLGLREVEPLLPRSQSKDAKEGSSAASSPLGAGRVGDLSGPLSLNEFAMRVASSIPYCRLRGVAGRELIRRVGIGCGSGGSFISAAMTRGCDVLLTGEATFHNCLEAQESDLALLLVGHFASEKFAMESLAEQLAVAFPAVRVWSSERERDPVIALS